MYLDSILLSRGVKTHGLNAYGQPGGDPATLLSAGFNLYPLEDASSTTIATLVSTVAAYKALGGACFSDLYGWGYDTGFMFNAAIVDPDDIEYELFGAQLSVQANMGDTTIYTKNFAGFPGYANGQHIMIGYGNPNYITELNVINTATFNGSGTTGIWTLTLQSPLAGIHPSGGGTHIYNYARPSVSDNINGVTIDSPQYKTLWNQYYSTINQSVSLSNFLGVAGWMASDHGVNYGGADGSPGGINMRAFTRFVNSPFGFYNSDVNSSGLHIDGTQCLLYSLKGALWTSFTGQTQVTVSGTFPNIVYSGGVIPTIPVALDLTYYHHYNHGELSSFGNYMATSNSVLELSLQQMISNAAGPSIWRTAIPNDVVTNTPGYSSQAAIEVMNSSIYTDFGFGTMQSNGGLGPFFALPYMNWGQPGDNSSNLGQTGVVGNATAATVIYFWTYVAIMLSHYPYLEADLAYDQLAAQLAATPWQPYASAFSKMPLYGGLYCYELDKIRLLTLDSIGWLNAGWYINLGLVAHQWGAASLASAPPLSNFNVIYGVPQDSDIPAIQAYINGGGTAVIPVVEEQGGGGFSSALAGLCGVTASGGGAAEGALSILVPTHPIWNPYNLTDIQNEYFLTYQGQAIRTVTGTNVTVLAKNNNGPVIWERTIGSGKMVCFVLPYGGAGFDGDGLSAGYSYLMLNAILHVVGQDSMIPAIYLSKWVSRTDWAVPLNNNGEGSGPNFNITISSSPNNPRRIWLANSGPTTITPNIHLSSKFYNITNPGSIIDVYSGSPITTGMTADIALTTPLNAGGWQVLYAPATSTQNPNPTTTTVTVSSA